MYPILFHQHQTPFTFAITHSLITANPTMLNPSSIIYHSSSMATPNIKLTQLPSPQFSWYSIEPPPCFAHLLIQSSDPFLKTTHAIGDIVQFKTYPTPCIFLGTKWTALVDNNEARREYIWGRFWNARNILLLCTTPYNLSSPASKSNPKRLHSSPPSYFIMGMVPG